MRAEKDRARYHRSQRDRFSIDLKRFAVETRGGRTFPPTDQYARIYVDLSVRKVCCVRKQQLAHLP